MTQLTVTLSDDQHYQMTGDVHDLSIRQTFNEQQPNHFGAPTATIEPLEVDGFVGDVASGGSCNASRITMVPHCNGTHTECVGHLTKDFLAVDELCPALPVAAQLITIDISNRKQIGAEALAQSWSINPHVSALVIRTTPNLNSKQYRRYGAEDTAFFTPDAVALIVSQNIDHLLIDLPSLDPYHDDGKLAAHRVFFGLPAADTQAVVSVSESTRAHATLTEMIFVPKTIPDDLYLLNLQVAPFAIDGAPSRPLLWALETT